MSLLVEERSSTYVHSIKSLVPGPFLKQTHHSMLKFRNSTCHLFAAKVAQEITKNNSITLFKLGCTQNLQCKLFPGKKCNQCHTIVVGTFSVIISFHSNSDLNRTTHSHFGELEITGSFIPRENT